MANMGANCVNAAHLVQCLEGISASPRAYPARLAVNPASAPFSSTSPARSIG
jgi:hypothetical protein